MKKYIFSIMLSLIVLSTLVFAETTELLEVPQKYQGIWKTMAMSEDRGVTKITGNGQAFCKVFASSVLTAEGKRVPFTSIRQQVSKGVEYTGLNFGNGILWVISDIGNSLILVQTLDAATGAEKLRVVFLVE